MEFDFTFCFSFVSFWLRSNQFVLFVHLSINPTNHEIKWLIVTILYDSCLVHRTTDSFQLTTVTLFMVPLLTTKKTPTPHIVSALAECELVYSHKFISTKARDSSSLLWRFGDTIGYALTSHTYSVTTECQSQSKMTQIMSRKTRTTNHCRWICCSIAFSNIQCNIKKSTHMKTNFLVLQHQSVPYFCHKCDPCLWFPPLFSLELWFLNNKNNKF